MLTDLHIRDFVIANELHLEFDAGLSVLTGETGAGKSILVDALGLVLGNRADTQAVRKGADKTDISGVFSLRNNQQATQWLETQELNSEEECVVRRVVNSKGGSKAFVNGKPVTLQQLKELGSYLLDIHGQHEHQAMLKTAVQRALLDNYGSYKKTLIQVQTAYDNWHEKRAQLEALTAAMSTRTARLELLQFQTDELEKVAPTETEFPELSDEQYKLSNVGTLAESSQESLDFLAAEKSGCQFALARARRALAQLYSIDASVSSIDELLETAEIQIEEAVSGLTRYIGNLDMDPARRDYVEQRLDTLSGLAKKHQVDPERLAPLLATLQEERAQLENAGESLDALGAELEQCAQVYSSAAGKLTTARKKAAKKLATAIGALVHQLGMPDADFGISVDTNSDKAWQRDGLDRVEFMIQANPGEPARPVAKVASGGELSRISLAIQVVAAASDGATSMIFDEVDAGVGGAVADMIGQRLQELGSALQVLAVTHLPQVACHGHQHFKVSKTQLDNRTHSQVQLLNEKERVEELARMLGGSKVTATTRTHAKELLTQAGSLRQSA